MVLDAAVWVADGEVSIGMDYGVQIEVRLAELGLRTERFHHSWDGDIPDARFHLMSGGSTPVSDTAGWMPHALRRTENLLTRAAAGETALFGICLGSQMIAHILAPGSVRGGSRIEAGLQEIKWHGLSGMPAIVPEFHYEEVDPVALTAAGGEILASNQHSGVQAYRYGDSVIGVQFHPELRSGHVRRLVEHNRETIEAYGGSAAEAAATVDARGDRMPDDSFASIFALLDPVQAARAA